MTWLCRDCFTTAVGPGSRRCPACASPRVVAHDELAALSIAHLDCDAFYASVEKRDRPELRDRPVHGRRREARRRRRRLLHRPHLRRALGHADVQGAQGLPRRGGHQARLRQVQARQPAPSWRSCERLTPLVQPLSLDEAWIDLSGTEAPERRLSGAGAGHGSGARSSATSASPSRSAWPPTRCLAKIASDLDKPRGFSVIGAAEAKAFLAPRPVTILPGVGPAMAASLQKAGLATVGDLAAADPKALVQRWGDLRPAAARPVPRPDARAVDPDHDRKGISAETTFNEDLTPARRARGPALALLREGGVAGSRAEGMAGRVATLKLQDHRLQAHHPPAHPARADPDRQEPVRGDARVASRRARSGLPANRRGALRHRRGQRRPGGSVRPGGNAGAQGREEPRHAPRPLRP